MFLGRDLGPAGEGNRKSWLQAGQRTAPGCACGEGRRPRQSSQAEWPQGSTRGTTEDSSYDCRHTGHSGNSIAGDSAGDANDSIC